MDPSDRAMAPSPPGVQPNFKNPDNYKTENIILHSVVLSFTTIAVIMRLYTRGIVKRSIGLDDYILFVAWALSLTYSTIFTWVTKLGFGMHIYDIRASNALPLFKWFSIALKFYFPVVLAVKLCILLGYHRMFKVDKKTKFAIWFGIVGNSVFYIVFFFIDIFRCTPVEAAWNPFVKGKCIPYAFFPWVTGIFNTISDFYIFVIPMPLLFQLSVPLSRRLRLIAIFGLGLFTCITSIMRMVSTANHSSDPDKTYYGAKEMHWPLLEINVGLICACAITFPALFDSTQPRSLGSLWSNLISGSTSSSRTDLGELDGTEELRVNVSSEFTVEDKSTSYTAGTV